MITLDVLDALYGKQQAYRSDQIAIATARVVLPMLDDAATEAVKAVVDGIRGALTDADEMRSRVGVPAYYERGAADLTKALRALLDALDCADEDLPALVAERDRLLVSWREGDRHTRAEHGLPPRKGTPS